MAWYLVTLMESFTVCLAYALFHIHRNTAIQFLTLMLCVKMSWFRNEVRSWAILTEVFRSYSLDAGREAVLFETKHDSSPVYGLPFIT
jgi:hypothetical protein